MYVVGGPIETSPPVEKPKKGNFNGKLNKSLVVELEEVVKAVNEGSSQIADARSYARFMGQV
jgi:3-mercaptopyruvate sulfurtransferase SseA